MVSVDVKHHVYYASMAEIGTDNRRPSSRDSSLITSTKVTSSLVIKEKAEGKVLYRVQTKNTPNNQINRKRRIYIRLQGLSIIM